MSTAAIPSMSDWTSATWEQIKSIITFQRSRMAALNNLCLAALVLLLELWCIVFLLLLTVMIPAVIVMGVVAVVLLPVALIIFAFIGSLIASWQLFPDLCVAESPHNSNSSRV